MPWVEAELEGRVWHPAVSKPHYPSMYPTPGQGQAQDLGAGTSEHEAPWGQGTAGLWSPTQS